MTSAFVLKIKCAIAIETTSVYQEKIVARENNFLAAGSFSNLAHKLIKDYNIY